MKQRVGIARALAVKPKVMFLDEPFSALDSFTATALRKELLVLWNEYKMTVVMVTHNIEEAVQLADRIAVMTSRPGTIDAILQNTLPRPRDPRSPEFFAMVDKLTALVTK
jgi:NitT/TauT family transport system ATP-binding protein